MSKNKTGFPTLLENIRALAQLLNLSADNKKKLDNQVYDNVRLSLINDILTKNILNPIKDLFPEMNQPIIGKIQEGLDIYRLEILRNQMVDGLNRNEIISILVKNFYAPFVKEFLYEELPEPYHFPYMDEIFQLENNSISVVMRWLEEQGFDINSFDYYGENSSVDKKKLIQDKIARLKKGDYILSLQELERLKNNKVDEQYLFWLFVARALDSIRRSQFKANFFDSSVRYLSSLEQEIHLAHLKIQPEFADVTPLIMSLFNKLHLNQRKTDNDKQISPQLLNLLRGKIEASERAYSLVYHLDWLEGR